MHLYAIIKTGGREYRVAPGKTVKFERLEAEPGEIIEFGEVCTLVNGDQTVSGQPIVEGARVRAQVVRHGQEKGIIVFKMKRRRLYQKKHDRLRQFTILKIDEINLGDDVFGKHDTDPRKIKKAIAAAKAVEIKKTKIAEPNKPEARPAVVETAAAKAPIEKPPVVKPPVKAQKISLSDRPPARTVELPQYNPETAPTARRTTGQDQSRNETTGNKTPGKRSWLVIIVALLILLALLAVFWDKDKAATVKEKPPVDIRLLETGQIDEPSNPTQPPD